MALQYCLAICCSSIQFSSMRSFSFRMFIVLAKAAADSLLARMVHHFKYESAFVVLPHRSSATAKGSGIFWLRSLIPKVTISLRTGFGISRSMWLGMVSLTVDHGEFTRSLNRMRACA